MCENETGCKDGDKCLFPHYKVDEQPSKKPKNEHSKRKKRRQGCCSCCGNCSPIGLCLARLRAVKTSNSNEVSGNPEAENLGAIRRGTSTPRQASIRENEGPSLEKLPVKVPHQRSPFAMKFEDRSQEGTERQERCARGKAWNLAKNIYNLKEKDKAAFYFPAEEWVLPAASRKEPEEREFVVDSAAGTHTASEKDLDSAELETMRISKNPTTVMTAIGEVETREDTTVYVKELDLFVAVMLLEETPAILSLGKLCEDHEFSYHWTSGQKPHLTKNGKRIKCKKAKYVPFLVPGLSTSSSTSSSPASSTSSSEDTVTSTENPATERSEIMSEESRGNPVVWITRNRKHK